MTTADPTSQANQVGRPRGLFCITKQDAGRLVWIFYRRGPVCSIRLGRTTDASRVVAKMEHYAACA